MPLIIGTNKHEAALFRWMKSPLMPITPEAINAMFAQIAAEQPHLVLPTDEQIESAYPGLRGKARGMGVARDVGFRMPSVWLAEGHVKARSVKRLKTQGESAWLRIMLSEGKNREIRRMLARLHHKVMRLRRTAIGPVELGSLSKGKSRRLSQAELEALRYATTKEKSHG